MQYLHTVKQEIVKYIPWAMTSVSDNLDIIATIKKKCTK